MGILSWTPRPPTFPRVSGCLAGGRKGQSPARGWGPSQREAALSAAPVGASALPAVKLTPAQVRPGWKYPLPAPRGRGAAWGLGSAAPCWWDGVGMQLAQESGWEPSWQGVPAAGRQRPALPRHHSPRWHSTKPHPVHPGKVLLPPRSPCRCRGVLFPKDCDAFTAGLASLSGQRGEEPCSCRGYQEESFPGSELETPAGITVPWLPGRAVPCCRVNG